MGKEFKDKPPTSLILHHKVHDIDGADFFHLVCHGSAWSYFHVFLKSLSFCPFWPTGFFTQ